MSTVTAAEQPVSRTRRRWILGGVIALLVLIAGYVAAQVAVGTSDIPRGTSVGGVDVGGLSVSEAAAKLTKNPPAAARAPITVRIAGDGTHTLEPAEAGLTVDAAASAQRAASRPWTPWAVVSALTGHRDLPALPSVDDTKLTVAVNGIAKGLASPFVEGAIVYQGTTPVATQPQAGKVLDVPALVAKVHAAFMVSDAPIDVALKEADPTVSEAEVQRVMTETAIPAVSAPVQLTAGKTTVTVTPEMIAAALTFTPADGTLKPFLDGTKLEAAVANQLTAVELKPKDAQIVFKNGAPVVVPGIVGHMADPAGIADAVQAVFGMPAPRTTALPVTDVQPTLTTEGAKALGVKEKIGEFTTYHPCCASRVTNIHTIADIVSGTLIMPGKTFDLNGIVGQRDVARGFVSAPMIDHGLFTESIGGGVSQFATTTFNAAFFAGFPIPTYQTHSYFISRYPAGREATVSWPEPDLKWVNDSPYGALVTTSYTGTSVTVTIWGTKRYDIESVSSDRYAPTMLTKPVYNTRPDCERALGGPGFSIDVWRVFSVGGKEIKREKFHTRYLPEPVIICGPKPPDKPTPTPTPTGGTGTPTPKPTATPTVKPDPTPTPTATGG